MLRWIGCAGTALAVVTALGCGDAGPAAPGGPHGPLVFNNFQNASVVIGQPSGYYRFPDGGGAVGPAGLHSPAGTVAAGSLYIPDKNNHRVLGFRAIPTADGAPADFVLGQPDFTSNGPGTSATTFNAPFSCAVAGGKLFISDFGNSRVLIWNTLPTTTGAPPDVVVGQVNFTSSAAATTRSGLSFPAGVAVAARRLFVADRDNNRVLIWNTIPTTNAAPADVVVGQADFTTSTYGGVTAASLGYPSALWTDGTRLVVSDQVGNRVLIWNAIPTTNGAPADVVVGAPDFTTTGPGGPRGETEGVTSDGTSLFVSSVGSHRVLIYRPFPTTNDPAPSGVLGQSNFTNTAPNDDNQDGVADAGPTRRTLYAPWGLAVIGNQLFVAEDGNNRILVFTSQ